MASDGSHPNDATARRRRIVEKGSDRLALITGARALNPPPPTSTPAHSYNASCPPSLTDENLYEADGSKTQPVLRRSGSIKTEASKEPSESRSSSIKKSKQHQTSSKLQIYLYKTVSPSQLQPAILASQDMRRKCSFFLGVAALLSHIGFPILGNYIIRSIILSKPLILLLFINVSIILGPPVLDAMKLIKQEELMNTATEDADLPDHCHHHNLGSPFEWGMLFKAGLHALFMDSCIYSVVVVCGTSFLAKFGL